MYLSLGVLLSVYNGEISHTYSVSKNYREKNRNLQEIILSQVSLLKFGNHDKNINETITEPFLGIIQHKNVLNVLKQLSLECVNDQIVFTWKALLHKYEFY